MMSTSIFVTAAIILVLLLLLVTGDEEETNSGEKDGRIELERDGALQLPELAMRIFSREDREFIFSTHSPRLQKMYRGERGKVALHWVRQTCREINKIMRTHRLSSRQSQNLNVAAELILFFHYAKLRFICALLVLLIKSLGPHALSDLARHAGDLSQRIARALPEASFANPGTSTEEPAVR
ncbi:MAG: hypothetical protein WBL63_00315 [Candidatus Acidiferrum sp.]